MLFTFLWETLKRSHTHKRVESRLSDQQLFQHSVL